MSDSVTKWHEMQDDKVNTASQWYTTTSIPVGPDFTKEAYTILSKYNTQAVRIANSILDKVEGTDAE